MKKYFLFSILVISINLISQNTSSGEYDFSDFVILYRTNAQSRIIEDKLRRQGIPYHIIGGVKFYERKTNKTKISKPYWCILDDLNGDMFSWSNRSGKIHGNANSGC